jgi:THO complex subunit 4
VSCPSKRQCQYLRPLQDLFERIAPVLTISLRYDRAGRSDGTAFVTYANVADARAAIRDFDGANAKGQPIRLTLLPIGPAGGRARPIGRRDNPFDRVENPRTLFDRIEPPQARRAGRNRSASPDDYNSYDEADSRRREPRRGSAPPTRDRRSDVTKPPPENIDRYVPGQSSGRNSSRRNEGRESGRRPGERRERGGGSDRGRGGRDRPERGENGARMVNGRPRKTQEELDAEMDDYWGSANTAGRDATAPAGKDSSHSAAPAAVTEPDDIDMIE